MLLFATYITRRIVELQRMKPKRRFSLAYINFLIIDPANFIYSIPWNSIRNCCRHIALNNRLVVDYYRESDISKVLGLYIERKGQPSLPHHRIRQRQTIIHSRPRSFVSIVVPITTKNRT